MSEESKNPEKRIIIDEDWKSQVEAEKKAAQEATESEEPSQPQAPPDAARTLPPANFSFLISTLYLQGAISLGVLPNPATNKTELQPEQAKHILDMLTMLQQKTEGNRTPKETTELETILHELRLAFVAMREQ